MPKGPSAQFMVYLPQTRITVPYTETIATPYLGTLDP